MQSDKPGLKIRRRPEEAPAAEVAPPAVAAVEAAVVPAVAPAAVEPAPVVRAAATAPSTTSQVTQTKAPPPAAKARPVQDDGPLPTTDDFAAMFAGESFSLREPEVGDAVSARVISISGETAFVDLSAKSEGAIATSEFVDADGNLTIAVGDEIQARVISVRGGIHLSRALTRGSGGSDILAQAWQAGIPVEGKVTGTNKGGFDVDVLGARGFCPFSQIDVNAGEPEQYIGQTYTFLITRCDDGGRNVVVSRSQLIRDEREARARQLLETLKPEDELDGRVTRVAQFGAFVDIGGIEGLVHVSELSYSRVESAEGYVQVGDPVRVKVLRIEEEKPGRFKIGLSMKALQSDPWVTSVQDLRAGDVLHGRVTRLASFGAFVEVAPGVEGLIRMADLDRKRVNTAQDAVQVGEEVDVQLVDIDFSRRQLRLSRKALLDNPWMQAAAAYPPGTTVQGTVDSVQSFGIFVALPNGIRGLLPLSHLAPGEDKRVHNLYRPEAAIEARVMEIDVDRERLTLTRREDSEGDERSNAETWRQQSRQAPTNLGSFGDLLKKR